MKNLRDHEAERAVLGALITGGAADADLAETYAKLEPSSFTNAQHSLVFDACRELYQANVEVDELTVSDKLRELGRLEDAGGVTNVATMVESTPTSANLKHYLAIVENHATRRTTCNALEAAKQAAADLQTPLVDALDKAGAALSTVAMSQSRAEQRSLSSLVREEMKRLEHEAQQDIERFGVPSGFHDLDNKLSGMQPGELLILAGRPGMGKTALALEMARHAAVTAEITTLVISLEMQARQLVQRALSSRAQVLSQRIRRPKKLDEAEWSRLVDKAGELDSKRMQIVDTPGLTVLDIRAQARLCRARHGLGLVVIDYLGLIRPVRREQSREREVAEISAGLKALAKELDLPVLCLAQLNRGVEARDQKRPRMSDLRDSGSVEQDADVVMFVHRDGYFDPKADDDTAEIVIAKNRTGPIGTVHIGWQPSLSRFFNTRSPS